jgi:hypothetical protein
MTLFLRLTARYTAIGLTLAGGFLGILAFFAMGLGFMLLDSLGD